MDGFPIQLSKIASPIAGGLGDVARYAYAEGPHSVTVTPNIAGHVPSRCATPKH